jgi:CRISPR-associated protein Cmr4
MKFKTYLIECITNLHVGSGDANYGIVDKLVQRDPVTDHPTIHATSLKGALREHFEQLKFSNLDDVFGTETKDGNETKSGSYKFMTADLLALPIRCTHHSYVLGLNKMLIDSLNHKSGVLVNNDKLINAVTDEDCLLASGTMPSEVYAEEFKLQTGKHGNYQFPKGLDFHQAASFVEEHFKLLTKNLPVIARNKLGKNNNLWYEEIVPHKTLFVTFIGTSKEDAAFEKLLLEGVVQVGANASVGYGLCKFTAL